MLLVVSDCIVNQTTLSKIDHYRRIAFTSEVGKCVRYLSGKQ